MTSPSTDLLPPGEATPSTGTDASRAAARSRELNDLAPTGEAVAPVDDHTGVLGGARRRWYLLAEHVQHPALPPVERTPRWWSLHGVGAFFAVTFFSWSMTPSLLPRPWYMQGLATGVCVALGYGIGVGVAVVFRRLGFAPAWKRNRRRVGWIALAVIALAVVTMSIVLGGHAQAVNRGLIGLPPENRGLDVLILPVAALVSVGLIALVRAFIQLGKIVAHFGSRFVPALPAKVIGVVAAATIAVLTIQDGVLPGLLAVGDRLAASTDGQTDPDLVPPTAPERSGSPASLIAWEDLGRHGRAFVAGGPTVADLEAFGGEPALLPVRAYAGLGESDDLREIARAAVADLRRAGGFDRSVLAVGTATGSGWINEATTTSLEYVLGGDCATVSMQYSYLPSPLAFVADRETPQEAGRALFDAVYEVWITLPVDERPRLVAFGESLGSYGGQSAFSGVDDMTTRLDGALWIGSPNFSQPWGRITTDRDPGSPERLPVVDAGEHLRFVDQPGDLIELGPWEAPRIVYLQHATDPVVWWSPDLMLSQPDWLREQRAPSVNPEMSWYPFVTFWQVTVDMVFSIDMPDGFGHAYELGTVDAWAAILDPPNWTAGDADRLRTLMSTGLDA